MAHLSYSFCLTMLHSLWQAVVLLLLFVSLDKTIINKTNPGQKRNFLFLLITTQLLLSAFTFYIYYTKEIAFSYITEVSAYFAQDTMLQMVAPWLFAAYLVMLLYRTTKVIYRWRSFQGQYKAGLIKPPADLKMFTRLNSNYFGIKRKVSLWLSNTITAPVTFGYFKPVILLPVALVNNLTVQQAETLILHELTHIKANDYLLNWFLLFTETVFFFNPAILSLCKRIRMEREKSCDVSVINFKYSPLVYAQTLLQAERQKQLLIPSFQLAAVNNKQQLLHRIQYFSNQSNYNQRKNNRLFITLTGSLLAVIFCFFALLQPVTVAKDETLLAAASNDQNNNFLSDALSEVNNPIFINNIISNVNEAKVVVEETMKELEKQKPLIEKELRDIAPELKRLKEMPAEAEAMEEEPSFATPVAATEADGTRQIVIKEEQSGSKNASVKVYTVTFQKGQWVLVPEWRAAAKERVHDSSVKIDLSQQ